MFLGLSAFFVFSALVLLILRFVRPEPLVCTGGVKDRIFLLLFVDFVISIIRAATVWNRRKSGQEFTIPSFIKEIIPVYPFLFFMAIWISTSPDEKTSTEEFMKNCGGSLTSTAEFLLGIHNMIGALVAFFFILILKNNKIRQS